jgi:hypothetical protein
MVTERLAQLHFILFKGVAMFRFVYAKQLFNEMPQ